MTIWILVPADTRHHNGVHFCAIIRSSASVPMLTYVIRMNRIANNEIDNMKLRRYLKPQSKCMEFGKDGKIRQKKQDG